jgi:hypothetical protein
LRQFAFILQNITDVNRNSRAGMGRLSVRSFSVLLSQKSVLDIRVISPGAMKEVTVVAVVASWLDNNTYTEVVCT